MRTFRVKLVGLRRSYASAGKSIRAETRRQPHRLLTTYSQHSPPQEIVERISKDRFPPGLSPAMNSSPMARPRIVQNWVVFLSLSLAAKGQRGTLLTAVFWSNISHSPVMPKIPSARSMSIITVRSVEPSATRRRGLATRPASRVTVRQPASRGGHIPAPMRPCPQQRGVRTAASKSRAARFVPMRTIMGPGADPLSATCTRPPPGRLERGIRSRRGAMPDRSPCMSSACFPALPY